MDPLRYPTLAMAARAAIDVQDACNASGIALSMFEAARTLRTVNGISDYNRHPIMQLFAYKLMALCMNEPMDTETQTMYTSALHMCSRLGEE